MSTLSAQVLQGIGKFIFVSCLLAVTTPPTVHQTICSPAPHGLLYWIFDAEVVRLAAVVSLALKWLHNLVFRIKTARPWFHSSSFCAGPNMVKGWFAWQRPANVYWRWQLTDKSLQTRLFVLVPGIATSSETRQGWYANIDIFQPFTRFKMRPSLVSSIFDGSCVFCQDSLFVCWHWIVSRHAPLL